MCLTRAIVSWASAPTFLVPSSCVCLCHVFVCRAYQTQAWKAGHKRECRKVEIQVGGEIDPVAGPVGVGPAANPRELMSTMLDLGKVENYRGVQALSTTAITTAEKLRVKYPRFYAHVWWLLCGAVLLRRPSASCVKDGWRTLQSRATQGHMSASLEMAQCCQGKRNC